MGFDAIADGNEQRAVRVEHQTRSVAAARRPHALVRARTADGLGFLGIHVDAERNEAAGDGPRVISPEGSPVTVLVVPTDEELAIAADALACAALLP